jgi:hypothetical protein
VEEHGIVALPSATGLADGPRKQSGEANSRLVIRILYQESHSRRDPRLRPEPRFMTGGVVGLCIAVANPPMPPEASG